jgi:hypothetical protein
MLIYKDLIPLFTGYPLFPGSGLVLFRITSE